jgi:hypothetical protein
LLLIALTLLGGALEAFAVSPGQSRRSRKVRRHKRYFWQPVLRGSRESLYRQNEEIDRLGLQRVRDDQHLEALVLENELVALESTRGECASIPAWTRTAAMRASGCVIF